MFDGKKRETERDRQRERRETEKTGIKRCEREIEVCEREKESKVKEGGLVLPSTDNMAVPLPLGADTV